MRSPVRTASRWFLLALVGAVATAVAAQQRDRLGDPGSLLLAVPGTLAIAVGLVWGVQSLLSAVGTARLRRGRGEIARWTVVAHDWERFREYDALRAQEGPGLAGEWTPRPATDRSVEVRFGRRQVLIDGSYHPLRRVAVPELVHVRWLQPTDAPECLEFGVRHPRGESGTVPMALRVPVPAEAREAGLRVFRHYEKVVPAPAAGLAVRRPRLVIGWSLGVTMMSCLAAATGWWRHREGDRGDLTLVLLVVGGIAGLAGGLFTLMALLLSRRGGTGSR